tara:strand:+ start:54 stop:242 length:189 start_codon:yes stop_codon:yes gene_type:complete
MDRTSEHLALVKAVVLHLLDLQAALLATLERAGQLNQKEHLPMIGLEELEEVIEEKLQALAM